LRVERADAEEPIVLAERDSHGGDVAEIGRAACRPDTGMPFGRLVQRGHWVRWRNGNKRHHQAGSRRGIRRILAVRGPTGVIYVTDIQRNRAPNYNGGQDLRERPYKLYRAAIDADPHSTSYFLSILS